MEEQECMSNSQKESIPAGILNIAPTIWRRFRLLCWPLHTLSLRDSINECQQVVFLSDAFSVLEGTAGDKLPCLAESLRSRSTEEKSCSGLPARYGLPENEKADELAKPGAKGRQQDNSVTFQEKKTLINALEQRTERDDFHFLDR